MQEFPVETELIYQPWDSYSLRIMKTVEEKSHQVLFIHGAPGSLDSFEKYFSVETLTDTAQLISYDRPGFGKSNYGHAITSIEEQAAAAMSLVKPGAIVVAHSFGGPIALRMAMDNPGYLGGLIIIAGSAAAEHEKIWFVNKPAEWPVFNWMMSRAWRVTNREKMTHLDELPLLDELWEKIDVPVVIIHGTEDSLVPYENALYAMEMLDSRYSRLISLEGEDHFLVWTELDLIISELLSMIENSGLSSADAIKEDTTNE